MPRVAVLFLVLAVPGAALAAPSARLLEDRLSDPSPERESPIATMSLETLEQAPSLGSARGFLITGGLFTAAGAVFFTIGFVGLVSGASYSYVASYLVALVAGIIHLAIGIPLLSAGSRKLNEREKWLAEHPDVTWLTPGTGGQIAIARW